MIQKTTKNILNEKDFNDFISFINKETNKGLKKFIQLSTTCNKPNIYDSLEKKSIETLIDKLKKHIEETIDIFCISSAGNIVENNDTIGISATITILEDISSLFSIRQFSLSEFSSVSIAEKIIAFVNNNPWIKSVEIYYPIQPEPLNLFIDKLNELPQKILVTGGIICNPDLSSPYSFSYYDKYDENGIIAIFYGGENLFIETQKVTGWRKIGKSMTVTSSEGNIIHTINNIPALNVYKKYLNIENNEDFMINAISFPLVYTLNGNDIFIDCVGATEDNSLITAGYIPEGAEIHLSYGHPQTILGSVEDVKYELEAYTPDAVRIVSCAARKEYWNNQEENQELAIFSDLCSTSGFLSHGEIIREFGNDKKPHIYMYNTTLVLTCFREGNIKDNVSYIHKEQENTKSPLASRLAHFLGVITAELEVSNEKLKIQATHDTLTGLYNVYQFNKDLKEAYMNEDTSLYHLLILDVNGLKFINDTFGHSEGDVLITEAASIILNSFGPSGTCYRIGGDEFAVIIECTDAKIEQLKEIFKKKSAGANTNFPYSIVIALGDSKLEENGEKKSLSDWKTDADLKMYANKHFTKKAIEITDDKMFSDTIRCIIALEEAKDAYTANHSMRVSKMATIIAEKMALSEITIKNINAAGYLHDIGKVGVDDNILKKEGKLTPEEFEEIKKHPGAGAEILQQSKQTQVLGPIVKHHHERYDGLGYPDNLTGTDIPIESRIIAIADSIDAMLSKRVYRDPLTLEQCYNEIEKNVGKMYDPAIARLTLKYFDEIILGGFERC